MVQIILAGYNVDAEVIKASKEAVRLAHEGKSEEALKILTERLKEDQFTPETISAAYARISRDERPIPELRAISRADVEGAKKSNRNILFGQSHKAVADGFIFNFDVLGLSRLAVEEAEARRIGCGYVEKSQRYITLKGDFVIPSEFSDSDKEKLVKIVEEQVKFYNNNLGTLIDYQARKNPELWKDAMQKKQKGVSDKMNSPKNTVEGWAKEDTRYALGLTTEAQIGLSFNARTLEHAIRTMRYSELAESREFSEKLLNETKDIAPSLIALADPEIFMREFGKELYDGNYKKTRKQMKKATSKAFVSDIVAPLFSQSRNNTDFLKRINENTKIKQKNDVKLILNSDIDTNILADILFGASRKSIEECYKTARRLKENPSKGRNFIKEVLKYKSEFDAVPREFEIDPGLNFEIILSSSAYAQIKRHRIMTLISQDYLPILGYTIPNSVKEAGLEQKMREVCDKSTELFFKFEKKYGKAAEYALTNAHKRRVLVHINPRELYHFSGMRCDTHAQWDIRNIAHDMLDLARNEAPLTLLLASGKSEYKDLRNKLYEK